MGAVEYLVTRSGAPVTLYAHGLLGSIAEARAFSSGVPGTAAFLHFRGHGRTSPADSRWDYAALADELLAVADHVGASQALGVSLGAGAILRSLTRDPRRFDRVALVLPAGVDEGRGAAAGAVWDTLAERIETADVPGVARSLLAAQPAEVRTQLPSAREYYEHVADAVVRDAATSATATAVRTLPRAAPVVDRELLRRVEVPVLVVCQRDDPLHPVEAGAELADLLPASRLHVLARPGALWLDRDELRAVLAEFLAG